MSKERLSKLQKCILTFILQHNNEFKELRKSNQRMLYSYVSGFYKKNPENKRSISASLSRSIRNLKKKGYIECSYFVYGGMLGRCMLTSKGYDVVNLPHVNDKDTFHQQNEANCYQVPKEEPVNNKSMQLEVKIKL